MSRLYKVKIGDVHLSSTGTAAGIGCKLEVDGIEDLLVQVTGVAIPSITGAPIFQMMPWTAGKQFSVRVETFIYKAQWEALKILLNDSLAAGTSFPVTGTGDIGNFSVTARAFPNKPFAAAGFTNDRIEQPAFRLITV